MTPATYRCLNLAAMEALRHVQLCPRGAAEGTFSGPHRSHFRGTAVEFADYREYSPGDDIRLIDWKVLARTDRQYIRLYDAERNLLTYLVVDTSGSMGYSGTAQVTLTKLEHAARLAAALGYVVVREGDEVGLSLGNQTLGKHLPVGASWAQLTRVLEALDAAQPEGQTNLPSVLGDVFKRCRRRGVLAVMSDFLDVSPEFWKSIDLFRRSQFDVMCFHIVHPEEQELPDVELARFVDSEGAAGQLNAEPEAIRENYRKRFAEFISEVQAGCVARGCDWYLARTSDNPQDFLRHCFLMRENM
jgi:uncharacterized protein (DUF58 family)